MTQKQCEKIGPVTLPLSTGDGVDVFVLWLIRFGMSRYLVMQKGDLSSSVSPLVRISSMCNYGHIWGSEYCDCKWQLEESKRRISREGSGVIIFAFDQHGKGVGLENHYRVYTEGQRLGLELVVDAYDALGFPEDLREYSDVAQILKDFGLRRIRLLTNSPKRMQALDSAGIEVERVSLEMPLTQYNEQELTVKKSKLGHLLSMCAPLLIQS